MGQIIKAGVAGAIVYFIWGMLAWMVVPLHTPTVATLPQERDVADLLKSQNLETGVYLVPHTTNSDEMSDPESEFSKNHIAGPIFSIYYKKDGAVPMSPSVMAGGFIINLLAAMLAATLLSCMGTCGTSYIARVGFVLGLGVFTAIVAHGSYWNWMHFPLDYTIAFMIDVVVGSLLAGLVIAYFVRPKDAISTTAADATSGAALAATAAAASPAKEAAREKVPAKPKPDVPARNDAISLLATLQREARFIDIVKEPLGDYSDEQVGAAARDVLRDCGSVLDRLFNLRPVVDEEDGASIEIPSNPDSGKFRIAGNVGSDAKSGSLVHHGWQAGKCELPKWTGSKAAALIVSPAELEVK